MRVGTTQEETAEPETLGPTSSGVQYTSEKTVEINGTAYTIVDDAEQLEDLEHQEELRSRPKRAKKRGKKGRYMTNDNLRNPQLDGYSNEYKIKRKLLRNQYYDKTTRPVRNDSSTTTLYVGMSLYHILDTVGAYFFLSLHCSETIVFKVLEGIS